MTREEYFWSLVNTEGLDHPEYGKCWVWCGAWMKQNGYGRFRYNGEHLAHRCVWLIAFGEIPEGMSVLHACDNPRCVRPEHLFLGDQQANLEDMRQKGRQVRGERQGSSRITENVVRVIRHRYSRYSHRNGTGALSKELGISATQVWRIAMGMSWRHVQ